MPIIMESTMYESTTEKIHGFHPDATEVSSVSSDSSPCCVKRLVELSDVLSESSSVSDRLSPSSLEIWLVSD